MGAFKKILLAVLALILIGGGVFYYLNSKDHYDPSKYSAKLTTASVASDAESDGLQKGTRVELTLPDQFDTPTSVGAEVEILILAFSKDAGGTVRGYLDKQEAGYLRSHNAIFIADISPFPVVLRNSVALPMLRESSYSVLLLYEEEMSKALKKKDQGDQITVATLTDNVVQDLRYIETEAELVAVFQSGD